MHKISRRLFLASAAGAILLEDMLANVPNDYTIEPSVEMQLRYAQWQQGRYDNIRTRSVKGDAMTLSFVNSIYGSDGLVTFNESSIFFRQSESNQDFYVIVKGQSHEAIKHHCGFTNNPNDYAPLKNNGRIVYGNALDVSERIRQVEAEKPELAGKLGFIAGRKPNKENIGDQTPYLVKAYYTKGTEDFVRQKIVCYAHNPPMAKPVP